MKSFPWPENDTEGLDKAKLECLQICMRELENLMEHAQYIAGAASGGSSSSSCASCCRTAIAAEFDREIFENAKSSVDEAGNSTCSILGRVGT